MIYVKPEVISLKDHPVYNELWVRDRIVEDPSILDLGDLDVKDAERRQPKAGRLDLLLQDPDTDRRYEIELMLGATDASHIIRTLEYWDIEQKRYPQYEHCAVIIAEDITSRFLNVISLFNSAIPIIAVQLKALNLEGKIALFFTKVLDEVERGEDDEDVPGPLADRAYWEQRSPKALRIVDECLSIVGESNVGFALAYKKNYIGFKKDDQSLNFVRFRLKREFVRVEAVVENRDLWRSRLEDAEFVILPGGPKRKRLHFRLRAEDIQQHRDLVKEFFNAILAQREEEA